MFWPESPGMAQAPETLRKKQSKQREEKSGDLIPQGAAGGGEGLPKSSAESATALRGFADQIAAGNRDAFCHRSRRRLRPGWRRFRSSLGRRSSGGRVSCGGHVLRLLPQSLGGETGADPKPST